jgi:hypothetical protein
MITHNDREQLQLNTKENQEPKWVNIHDALPPDEAAVVQVRRKLDAALPGPIEWEMWSCNVRMHTDEVGWWMLK